MKKHIKAWTGALFLLAVSAVILTVAFTSPQPYSRTSLGQSMGLPSFAAGEKTGCCAPVPAISIGCAAGVLALICLPACRGKQTGTPKT